MVALIQTPRAAPPPARRVAPREASWRYVERGRSHAVLARWVEARQTFELVETDPSAPDARLAGSFACARPWEARVALWLLDARLAQLGEYWRSGAGAPGWSRVARPHGAPIADDRPNEVLGAPRASHIHHYHGARGEDALLLAIRGHEAARYVVARAKLDATKLEVERIELLHTAVSAPLARSAILREQLTLAQQGTPKLVTRSDYETVLGPGGHRRAAGLLESVLDVVRDETGREAPGDRDADAYDAFLVKLHDPRLLALHHRFLGEEQEEDLLVGGAPAIRRFIAAQRGQVGHTEQHLVTILEASLLARERIRSGSLTRADPEVRALNRLAYYL